MSVLSECKTLIEGLSIPVETGVFEGTAPETYVVIVPLTDTFELHADNTPGFEVQEARLGGLMLRVSSCRERLEAYLAGKIDRIEELEEKILPLNPAEKEGYLQSNNYRDIVSAGIL